MASEQTQFNVNKRPKDDISDDEDALKHACKVCNATKDEAKIKWLLKCIEINELFRDLNATQKRHIVLEMKLIEIQQNTIVLQQHSVMPQTVYVVEDGEFFAVIDGMRVRSWIRAGIFGELALLYDSPRAATIECVSTVGHLWELDRTTFQNIINQYANVETAEQKEKEDEFTDLMISPMIALKKRASIRVIKKEIKLKSRAFNEDDQLKILFGKDKTKTKTKTKLINDSDTNNSANNPTDVMNCIQFKRIAYILSKYQKNEMCDNKYEYLQQMFGDYSQLCDDFCYVVNTHGNDYDFEILYNIIISTYFNDTECDINKCAMFQRNMRDRSDYEQNMQKYYAQSNMDNIDRKQIIAIQLLDKIHCYFLHCYDQNHRLRNNESLSNVSQVIDVIRGRKQLSLTRERVHQNKYNMTAMSAMNATAETEKKEKDGDIVYSFGFEYWYWDNMNDAKQSEHSNRLHVPKKYTDLKQELLNNIIHSIKAEQWMILHEKASDYIGMRYVLQTYKADWNNRGIKRGVPISKSHLICLMLYCNYDKLQKLFTQTYRKLNENEPNELLIKRHSNFYHFGKLLYEAVNIYGKSIKDYQYKQFFHGINSEMMFSSPKARIYGPLSTTVAIAVAIHFSQQGGLVVTLQGDEWEDNKYFDMAWISEYSSEYECFYIGGLLPLRFKNILNTKTGADYSKHLPKFSILFNKIFAGVKYIFSGIKGVKEKKIIEKLINKRLNTLNENNIDKEYIFRLFDYYCIKRDFVSINYPYFQQEFDVFFDAQNMINLHDLFNIFPNVKHLKIDYVCLSQEFMQHLLDSIVIKSGDINITHNDEKKETQNFVLEKIQLNWPNVATDDKHDIAIGEIISQFHDKFHSVNFDIQYNKQENKLFITQTI